MVDESPSVPRSLTRRQALRGLAGVVVGAAGLAYVDGSTPAVAAVGRRLGFPHAPDAAGTGTQLTGRVIRPADGDYDAARQLWDYLFTSYPSVIVYCDTTTDVLNAVRWAREHGVAIRARSGGHSLEGWSSVDGGIVIDVSGLRGSEIDTKSKTATLGVGLTQGQVVNALGPDGYAIPTGSEATVGLGGVMLGGGIGLMSRSMGATCDNLLEVEMVVPSGTRGARVVTANESSNPDLLWACRGGGGGNFGIATSYKVRLHSIPSPVTLFEIDWPFASLVPALAAWQKWAPAVDNRMGSTFTALPASGDVVMANGLFLGPDDQARQLLGPLLAVPGGTPKFTVQPWVDYFNSSNAGPRQDRFWKFTSSWAYQPFSNQALDTIASFMTRAPAPDCNYWTLSWGGAVRTAPSGGSAFYHRKPLFYAEPGAGWNDETLTPACYAWVQEFRDALTNDVSGAYVNVPDRAIAEWGPAYYGTNFERLRSVKATYDPQNVFQFEQSIPPS